jgi:F0F1-type ATP synthase membrane subunit c/vacuolar-type H+-ATPase subunit K
MVLLQSIAQAPLIFSFIISLLIKNEITTIQSSYHGFILFCVSVIVAVGCIGPSLGQAYFLRSALTAFGIQRNAYNLLFAFSLLSVAVIETPVIFSLISSLILLYRPFFETGGFMAAVSAGSIVLSMAFGALGTGTGLGYITAQAIQQIAQTPENYGHIFRTALISIGFVESSVIYALIVSLMLLIT